MTAKAAEYAVKEATVDFFFQDPRAGRLSDLVGAWAGENAKDNYLSWLQSDETDTDSEARFKNAVEGMLLEAPFSVVMKGLETGTKMAGSALRGGLGLTENFMGAARADRTIRNLTNKLSQISDDQERASVLSALEAAISNPEGRNVNAVRAAVAGDLGDGRSPLLYGANDFDQILLKKTRGRIDSLNDQELIVCSLTVKAKCVPPSRPMAFLSMSPMKWKLSPITLAGMELRYSLPWRLLRKRLLVLPLSACSNLKKNSRLLAAVSTYLLTVG
jgi:hypothetical protein